jgi:acetate kinase
MAPDPASVLAINGGSSSIKFAVYQAGAPQKPSLSGKLDRIGLDGTTLSWETTEEGAGESQMEVPDHEPGPDLLIDWLEAREEFAAVSAVGHRVVHGMAHMEPERVTPDLLDELHRATPYAPDHLPRELELIEAFGDRHPDLPQVACFDTAFHGTMPRVATLLPIPRRYQRKGVQRYGFHGLSYAYLLEELARAAGPEAANGRVILAHLGNGASLAAVQRGGSMDTSMGFTPAAGLVMSTRTGDLDPGLVSFLAHTELRRSSIR